MKDITLLGIDIAKQVFQFHGTDARGHTVMQKKVKRSQVLKWIANLPPCCIAMEACGGANYWARQFQAFGHEVKLISPQFVKPYVKTNKNDRNDAQAINEAASRPHMRFVTPKSIEQQDLQNLHRIRTRLVKQRTALGNQIRGLLSEYGIVFPQSLSQLRRRLLEVLEDGDNELTMLTREVVNELREELVTLDARIQAFEQRIKQAFGQDERCQRIAQVGGIGEISATAVVAAIGSGKHFRHGRQFAAWLGLVPKQFSSGGKERLLGISKRGDGYLRQLLIHGARAVLRHVDGKSDVRSRYWSAKKHRLGMNKAAVALANKNARVIWALLSREEDFDGNRHAVCVN